MLFKNLSNQYIGETVMNPEPETSYLISLQDRPRKHQSIINDYEVSEDVARKFYFQFIQLWGKKVKFETAEGVTVEGYLHKVNGQF